jgi:hypothetical protein
MTPSPQTELDKAFLRGLMAAAIKIGEAMDRVSDDGPEAMAIAALLVIERLAGTEPCGRAN